MNLFNHGLTASDIAALLADRHAKDVFVPECKDGPTWASSHSRLDAWAMKRSWSNQIVWGYEIKVSRSDFLQDNKWPSYLACCNQFFFVCPRGMIQAHEIPSDVGLIYATPGGKRLSVVRKAAHRDVDIPETLYRYLLMCRTRVVDSSYYAEPPSGRDAKVESWRSWLAEKQENAELGCEVSRRVRGIVDQVKRENRSLKARIDRADFVLAACKKLGLDISTFDSEDSIAAKFQRILQSEIPPEFFESVNDLHNALSSVRAVIEKYRKQ